MSGRPIGDPPAQFSALRDGERLILIAPTIHSAMTGAWRCEQDRTGEVTLYYVDGTRETARLSCDVRDIPGEWLGLVSAIQAKRAKARGGAP